MAGGTDTAEVARPVAAGIQERTLILCSHGTADRSGQAAIRALAETVRARLPGVRVLETFADVQHPQVGEVVQTLAEGEHAVIVPLLMSSGFHVRVDIGDAARSRPGVSVSEVLGPDPRITDIVMRELAEAGVDADEPVVLAAAGSSDDRSLGDVAAALDMVRQRRSGPVSVAFASAASPSVPEEVERLRAQGVPRVVVASYLLAPGLFQRRIEESGADVVTPPLVSAPEVLEIVLERYRGASHQA